VKFSFCQRGRQRGRAEVRVWICRTVSKGCFREILVRSMIRIHKAIYLFHGAKGVATPCEVKPLGSADNLYPLTWPHASPHRYPDFFNPLQGRARCFSPPSADVSPPFSDPLRLNLIFVELLLDTMSIDPDLIPPFSPTFNFPSILCLDHSRWFNHLTS